jgi:hypothetical protein
MRNSKNIISVIGQLTAQLSLAKFLSFAAEIFIY